MADESGSYNILIGTILGTLLLGMLVLVFKSDYRVSQITLSNQDYYPNVEVKSDPD